MAVIYLPSLIVFAWKRRNLSIYNSLMNIFYYPSEPIVDSIVMIARKNNNSGTDFYSGWILPLLKVFFTFNFFNIRRGEEHHAEQKKDTGFFLTVY